MAPLGRSDKNLHFSDPHNLGASRPLSDRHSGVLKGVPPLTYVSMPYAPLIALNVQYVALITAYTNS